MGFLNLIYLIRAINRWMHKNDQMLYTKEEIEEMKKKYGKKDDDSRPGGPPQIR